MSSSQLIRTICGDDAFWDSQLSWNTTNPQFTECFQVTLLTGFPVVIMILTILTHAFRDKSFDLENWTFLKWTRLTLIIFACLANILYSSLLTQRYYRSQYRVLLAYTIIQLVKAACYVFLTMIYFKQRLSVKSGMMWLFLVTETFFSIIIYHDKWVTYDSQVLSEFVFYTIYVPILILLLILFCFNEGLRLRNPLNHHHHLHNPSSTLEKPLFETKMCPKSQASFINRIFFLWFTKLILLGRRKALGTEDMWQLKGNLQAAILSEYFDQAISVSKTVFQAVLNHLRNCIQRIISCGKSPSIETKLTSVVTKNIDVVTLSMRLFARKFCVAILLTLLTDIFTLLVPILIKAFIGFIQYEYEQPAWHGFLLAICLFAANITMNLLQIQLKECQQCLGLRMTATISAAIYKKALKKTQSSWRDFETGKLMNMVSVDTRRLLEFMEFFYVLFSAPFRFVVSVYLLQQALGPSALYALLIMAIWFPFNLSVIRFMKRQQARKMEETDKRVRFVNEVLNGVKIVKLYAWEESFMEYIAKLRDSELKYLKTMAFLQAAIILQSPLLPLIFSVLIFGTYMLTNTEPLTAQNIFFVLSIAATIQMPLQRFCTVIEKYTLAMVSCRRINSFLNLGDPEQYISRDEDKDAIRIEEASFSWKDGTIKVESEKKINKGLTKNSSKSALNPSESVSMEWKPADLENINIRIPKKSFTAIIGPVGSGKSSLLSAILGEMNLTQGKINIDGGSDLAFISQQPWCQHMTLRDNILFGKPFIKEKYDRTLTACALAEDINILPDGDSTEIGENGINLSGGQKQRVSIARAVYSDADLFLFDDPLSAVDGPVARHLIENVLSSKTGLLKDKTRVLVTNNLDILQEVDKIIMLENGAIIETGTYKELIEAEGSLARLAQKLSLRERKKKEEEEKNEASAMEIDADEKDDNPKETKNIVENEFLESGKIDWAVYKQYFKKIPFLWFAVTSCAAAIWFATLISSNMWLAIWADKANSEDDPWWRYTVFSSITLAQGIGIVVTMIGSNIASVHSCRGLHKDLASGILLSPLSFFEKTPIGRILNRFSRDMDVVDMWIRLVICCLIIAAIDCIGALCNIAIQAPVFILVMLPLGFIFSIFPRVYMPATRQLKRLDSTTRSPIYSYIGESVSGIVTIRAYGVQNRFINEFFQRIDTNQNTAYLSVMSILWRQMILGIFGSLLLFLVAIFGIISKDSIGPGDIGLMLVAAQRVTESSIMCLDFIAELEVNIVCVERIAEYSALPPEGERFQGKRDPGPNWPTQGSIHFDHYSTRYRPELDKVLSGIECTIGSGEKIGIVGRTGAGKSTISLALFRILKACEGGILIDDCNIDDLGLHTLRSRLAIIPQDPVIFCGSLRFNLDPFDKYSDDEIWACLELSHLKKYFEQSGAGLDFQASEGGKNLSLGQRQLICLTRALLKKSKVLVLDEATAAIDMETDALVQETIRSQFSDCTILTIAHRLNTIMDSDRILVLDAGKIVEFDSPANLMKNQVSYFHSLAKEAGLLPKN